MENIIKKEFAIIETLQDRNDLIAKSKSLFSNDLPGRLWNVYMKIGDKAMFKFSMTMDIFVIIKNLFLINFKCSKLKEFTQIYLDYLDRFELYLRETNEIDNQYTDKLGPDGKLTNDNKLINLTLDNISKFLTLSYNLLILYKEPIMLKKSLQKIIKNDTKEKVTAGAVRKVSRKTSKKSKKSKRKSKK